MTHQSDVRNARGAHDATQWPHKLRRLVQLFEELFSLEELRRFVALSHLREIHLELPGSTIATQAHALIETLSRRNLINADLFNSLLRERPAQARKIQVVATEWGIEIKIEYSEEQPSSAERRSENQPVSRTPSDDSHKNVLDNRSWILAFTFGIVFIALLLAIAIMVPRWTPEQTLVFRVVLALAAAGIGAVLPGLLDVRARWADNLGLRAGGAVSLFVIVFLVTPTSPHDNTPDAKANGNNSIQGRPLDSDLHIVEPGEKPKTAEAAKNENKNEVLQTERSIEQESKPLKFCHAQKYEILADVTSAHSAHSRLVLLEYFNKTWRLSADAPYPLENPITRGTMETNSPVGEQESIAAIAFTDESEAKIFVKELKARNRGSKETSIDTIKTVFAAQSGSSVGCLEYSIDPSCKAKKTLETLTLKLTGDDLACIERIGNRPPDTFLPK